MANVEYMHICDYAFPAQGGKPCIIGIFEIIWAAAFPATHPRMSIAIQLRGTPHEVIPFVIELGRPNGDVLSRVEGQVPASEDGGAFIGGEMINLLFAEAGRYTIKVSSAGQVLTTQSLHLKKIKSPQGAAPAPPSQRH